MLVERVTKWYQVSMKLQLNPLFKDPLRLEEKNSFGSICIPATQ